jgi:V/A-type H+-transporting ATPase subunit I
MIFRPAEVVKLFCLFHKSRRSQVLDALQVIGLVEFFDVKDRYPDLNMPETYTSDVTRELNRVKTLLSEALPHNREVSFTEQVLGPKMSPLKLMPKKTYEVLKESHARLDDIEREFDGLRGRPKENFRNKYRFELLVLREELENAFERMKAVEKFGATKDTLVLGCWVEKDNVMKVVRALDKATEDACVISAEDPRPGEFVPVALQNPRILKPYELLAKAYGMPRYRELDPTPILALTFTLFFGIMFADVGYGLLIIGLGLAVFFKTRKSSEVQRDLNLLVVYGGTASVVFGFLFGEFFGGLIHLGPRFIGSDIVVLLERLILFTILVGVVHISISLVSRLASAFLSKETPLYPVALIAILWSSTALAFSWWEPIPPWLALAAKLLLVGGLLSLFWAKGAEALVEIMALFTNIMSYIRIAVVLLFHIVVARLLYDTVYGVPRTIIGVVFGIIAFSSGAALILTLGVFMTFVQSLRLHWLEFFRRFYSGTGESFKYFTRKCKYTYCY